MSSAEGTTYDAWLRSEADTGPRPGRVLGPGRAVALVPEALFAARPADLELAVALPGEIVRLPVTAVSALATVGDGSVLVVLGIPVEPGVPDGAVLERMLAEVLAGPEVGGIGGWTPGGAVPPRPAGLDELGPPAGRVGTYRDLRPAVTPASEPDIGVRLGNGICNWFWWWC